MDHRGDAVTDIGRYRKKNQDRIIYRHMYHGGRAISIACVCDGIGSFANSEIAAEMMVSGINSWFEGVATCFPENINNDDLVADLETTLYELNELVYEYPQQHGEQIGCTMSLLLFIDADYYMFHVGDSKIFCLGARYEQITRDEVISKQVLGKEKSYLANFVGKNQTLEVQKLIGSAKRYELYILGSDGLFKKLTAEDVELIGRCLDAGRSMKEICRMLINLVLGRGEKDNVSCSIVQIIDKEF